MILIFFARLLDESFMAIGAAVTHRRRAMIVKAPMMNGIRSAIDVGGRLARARRRRALPGHPTRVLALRQATCSGQVHV